MRRGEQHEAFELLHDLTREHVDRGDALDLVAEHRDAHRALLVGGEHLDRVAAHPELVAGEVVVVALVLQLDHPRQDRPLLALLPHVHDEALARVLLGTAEAVDGGHRRDDHTSRRDINALVAEWRSRSISSLIDESFSM